MTSAEHVSKEAHERALEQRDARIAELERRNAEAERRNAEVERQLEWFRRQLFGRTSEKRLFPNDPRQLCLGDSFEACVPQEKETVKGYERRINPRPLDDKSESDSLLRFDESVPVETIEILPEELQGLAEDEYELISEKVTHRLAQRPGSYVVLKFVRKVAKLKEKQELVCAPAPQAVLERSLADVSLLAGILIDKFLYHLPLFRQHQRLKAAGITLSRVTLTNYVHRAIDLLGPIYYAQLSSILQSAVLLMDETPIKAGRATERGKLHKGYYWPLLGEQSEVAFPFGATRGENAAREVLGQYCGTLVTDGYKVYEKVVGAQEQIRHAQCWVHARRQFLKAEAMEPELVSHALELIGELYTVEEEAKKLKAPQRLELRLRRSIDIIDQFFAWLRKELSTRALLPSNPFTAAASYALEREQALRVFLSDPDVPLDTNDLERALRPIPMGRKNWLFCWTEIGAEYVGHIQSLLVTCKLHGVEPYTYLVDVLQRVDSHPAEDVHLLTPRLWKEQFADNPLRSELDRIAKNAAH